jgi:hypothetical protein
LTRSGSQFEIETPEAGLRSSDSEQASNRVLVVVAFGIDQTAVLRGSHNETVTALLAVVQVRVDVRTPISDSDPTHIWGWWCLAKGLTGSQPDLAFTRPLPAGVTVVVAFTLGSWHTPVVLLMRESEYAHARAFALALSGRDPEHGQHGLQQKALHAGFAVGDWAKARDVSFVGPEEFAVVLDQQVRSGLLDVLLDERLMGFLQAVWGDLRQVEEGVGGFYGTTGVEQLREARAGTGGVG